MNLATLRSLRSRIKLHKVRALGPALLVASLVTFVAALTANANERQRIAVRRGEIGVALSQVTARLQSAINLMSIEAHQCAAGATTLDPVNPDRIRWRVDGQSAPVISAERASLATALARAARREPARRLFGPLPAADGHEYLLARFVLPDASASCVAGAPLELLLADAGAQRMTRGDVDLRLIDSTGRVLFQSRPFAPRAPESARLGLPNLPWVIEAQPKEGWEQGALARWTMLFLLGCAAGTGMYFTQRRIDNLRAEVGVLYERLHGMSANLTEALTRSEQTEQRAMALAQLDGGTGLPNRQSTIQALDLHLTHVRERATPALTAFVVQFESLREIEKALGRNHLHNAMREAAARLTALEGIRGNIGRIGDIELAFWLDLESDSMEAETIAAQSSQVLAYPFEVGKSTAHVSFGIGLASRPDSQCAGEDLLEQASAAAEEAARHHSGAWRRFEPGARAKRIDQLRVETELRRALEGEGLSLHYQPILEFESQRLAGFEALIRWQHPLQGLLLPGAFLPVAEHAQMLLEIDRWVMRESIMQARQWEVDGSRDFYISINISPQHFARMELAEELAELLRVHKVPAKRVRLEIVENALVSDMETAIAVASALRAQGVQLCLDDFGTGYSSLGYLRSLPLDAIKVDRFFVERMVTDTRDFGLVKTIIDLARYLEVRCVVEGVSTTEQHELLSVLAPDFAQGNLYSKPVPAARAEQMLRGAADFSMPREMAS